MPEQIAVIIPAKDEAARIADTVRSAALIPNVHLVLVVDDGSSDNTGALAEAAGAEVIRHRHNKGKAAAMETGARAVAVIERGQGHRNQPFATRHALLFIDADLGETAVNTAPLTQPVVNGTADMTIALLPRQATAGGGRGFVVNLARRGIAQATGWEPTQPLSGMRCLTGEAFAAAQPLAHGWGVETGLTIDLLQGGMRVEEVPCELQHRVTGRDWRGQLHRAKQYRDVARALAVRRLKRLRRR